MASSRSRARALARRTALGSLPPLRRVVDERHDLRRHQAELRQQLAAAKGRVDELSAELLLTYRYVFVVSYSGAGATLLRTVLNSSPGIMIRGENSDLLHRFFLYQRMMQQVRKRYAHRPPRGSTNPWYGFEDWRAAESLAGIRRLVVQTVLHPRPGTRVLGSTETRWWHDDWRDYITFVQELFPGARFILHTRDAAETDAGRQMHEVLGRAAYVVHYDDFVADPDRLAGLYDWLGEPFDRDAIHGVIEQSNGHT